MAEEEPTTLELVIKQQKRLLSKQRKQGAKLEKILTRLRAIRKESRK